MPLVILGGGETGTGSAILAKQQGIDVFVSDSGTIAEKYKQEIIAHDIPFEEQGHNFMTMDTISEVIKSQGILDSAAVIKKLRAANIPIIDEIEFATRFINKESKIIAVTGTNGKSTTTSLIYHLLHAAGLSVVVAGNIGYSLAKAVANGKYDYYVLELSCFQIGYLKEFKADIICLSNITVDHLDRYENSMELYAMAKLSLLRNMTAADHFIYNTDDLVTQANVDKSKIVPTKWPFTRDPTNPAPIFASEQSLNVTIDGQCFSFPKNLLTIPGPHNEYNAMAAITAALLAGVPAATISLALPTFAGLPHRIEWCGAPNGINCYNDSKATNIGSTVVALNSFDQPIVWIVGGVDKGNDYKDILPIIENKVKAIVCLGKDNTKIIESFSHLNIDIQETDNISSAVNAALSKACPGSVIVLSPACASFDLFRNAEDRGDQFRDKIKSLLTKL